jgi:hypothetical protein
MTEYTVGSNTGTGESATGQVKDQVGGTAQVVQE